MNEADATLKALEARWQLPLPASFHRLYRAFEYPFLSPCEFLPLDELLDGGERWRGMLPQFVPFGRDLEEGFYGFYVPPITAGPDYPVLAWDHEYDHYYPVASGFDSFLRWCVVTGRYIEQDAAADDLAADENAVRRELVDKVGLPTLLLTDPVARNDHELSERLAALDPQGAHSLVQSGSFYLGRREMTRARDLFARASEGAPWFGDPYYLLAETYRQEGADGDAIERWWQVLQCPIALSTRTGRYDLGADYPDCEVSEAAVQALAERAATVPQAMANHRLMRLVLSEDPFDPLARLSAAGDLLAEGDMSGGERELLNALTLATEEEDLTAAYEKLVAHYERANRHREAGLCRDDARLE